MVQKLPNLLHWQRKLLRQKHEKMDFPWEPQIFVSNMNRKQQVVKYWSKVPIIFFFFSTYYLLIFITLYNILHLKEALMEIRNKA